MTTRRTAIAAGLAALIPATGLTQSENESVDLLRRLIVEVIQDGDVTVIPELVAEDASIPDYGVTGIDAFTAASESGHASRHGQFDDYTFVVEAIAGTDEWALAYVRLQGTTRAGQSVDDPAFYTVRVADSLITELYLGAG